MHQMLKVILSLFVLQSSLPVVNAVGSPDIEWSQFEDIIQLPSPDSSPERQEYIRSEPLPSQSEPGRTKKKKTSVRSKEAIRRASETERVKIENDAGFATKRKAQKALAMQKHRLKVTTGLTKEQREARNKRRNENNRKHYQVSKERFGGAYGNTKARQIQESNKRIKNGTASLEDFKRVHEFRKKSNQAVRNSRSKKRKADDD